jgi:hypothetical protein
MGFIFQTNLAFDVDIDALWLFISCLREKNPIDMYESSCWNDMNMIVQVE